MDRRGFIGGLLAAPFAALLGKKDAPEDPLLTSVNGQRVDTFGYLRVQPFRTPFNDEDVPVWTYYKGPMTWTNKIVLKET